MQKELPVGSMWVVVHKLELLPGRKQAEEHTSPVPAAFYHTNLDSYHSH